jgi:hypothetical protein
LLPAQHEKSSAQEKYPVDIVFCMDLSASTNGLINDLRDKMWDIINQVNTVKPAPKLRLAAVGFARPSFGGSTGYAKVLIDLTHDYDLVSYELFKLKSFVEKGDQFVGSALFQCLKNIHWNNNENTLKLIYLVGNGRPDLGDIDFREACEDAKEKNIRIVPVYCSNSGWKREMFLWKQIANISETEIQEIQIHKRPLEISTTDESRLVAELNDQLNKTFLFYGMEGYSRYKLLLEADSNSMLNNLMLLHPRTFYKISDHYLSQCTQWDLVSFSNSTGYNLEKVDRFTLPESLQLMTDAELHNHIAAMKKQRELVIGQLRTLLPLNRQELIDVMRKEKKIYEVNTLESVVIRTFYKIATAHGFAVQ